MRLLIATVVFWLLMVSTVSADIIFPNQPPRSRWRPPSRPIPESTPEEPLPSSGVPGADKFPVPPPIVVPAPDTTPEEAGFAIVAVGLVVVVLSVRESRAARRPSRRTPLRPLS